MKRAVYAPATIILVSPYCSSAVTEQSRARVASAGDVDNVLAEVDGYARGGVI